VNNSKKILVIVGPTATGKTDLGIYLAKKFKGEIIACDSRQVYRDLDIGSGKLPSVNSKFKIKNSKWEVDGVNIWMYDVADPTSQYTAFDYAQEADKVLKQVLSRGKLPIIVGGSGLYLKAILEGFSVKSPINHKLRQKLEQLSLIDLQVKLQKLSPDKFKNLNNSDRNNPRRLIRYIEISMYGHVSESSKYKVQSYDVLKIGLEVPRGILNHRIDLRLDLRIKQGLIEEAQRLRKAGVSDERLERLGLEYKYLAFHLRGVISKPDMVKELKNKIHQYAKRQLNWFKKDSEIHWFDITKLGYQNQLESEVKNWYYRG